MPTLLYFKNKKTDSRVEVMDMSGKALKFFRIAEKLYDLHFPGTNPSMVRCFWNNSNRPPEALKFDVEFGRSDDATPSDLFVVEVFVEHPHNGMAHIRWSELSGGTWYEGRHYGHYTGETEIMLN